MRRYRFFLLTALVVSFSVGVGEFVWPYGRAELRSWALWRQVQHGPGAVVDFTEVGPSGWDRLFIFHPYTPDSSIHEALGYQWPDTKWTSIGRNEGVNLVVFTKAGRVAGWFEHPRNRGDLTGVAGMDGYPREKARFTVALDQESRFVLTSR
jgi:hypothetical protein